MMYKTERQRADYEVDRLKSLIKESSLNYSLNESPFSISLKVRKTFVRDFTKGSISTSTPCPKRTVQSTTFSADDLSIPQNDSQQNENADIPDSAIDIEEDNSKNTSTINMLESKLLNSEEEKKEMKTKLEILNNKLKECADLNLNYKKTLNEQKSDLFNLTQKNIELQNHISNLDKEYKEKDETAKREANEASTATEKKAKKEKESAIEKAKEAATIAARKKSEKECIALVSTISRLKEETVAAKRKTDEAAAASNKKAEEAVDVAEKKAKERVDAAEKKVKKAIDAAEKKAKEAIDAAEKKTKDAVNDAEKKVKKADAAEKKAKETVGSAEKKAKDAVNDAENKVKRAKDAAEKKAKETVESAEKKAKDAVNDADKKVKKAVDAAEKKAKEARDAAEKKAVDDDKKTKEINNLNLKISALCNCYCTEIEDKIIEDKSENFDSILSLIHDHEQEILVDKACFYEYLDQNKT